MASGHYRTALNTGEIKPCPKKFLPKSLIEGRSDRPSVRIVAVPKVLPVRMKKEQKKKNGVGSAGAGCRPFQK